MGNHYATTVTSVADFNNKRMPVEETQNAEWTWRNRGADTSNTRWLESPQIFFMRDAFNANASTYYDADTDKLMIDFKFDSDCWFTGEFKRIE